MTFAQQPHGEVGEQGTPNMQDDKLECALETVGDAARIAVVFKLIIHVAKIWRKRIKRSKSEEP